MTDDDPRVVKPADLLSGVRSNAELNRFSSKLLSKTDPPGTPYAKMRLGVVVAFDATTWTVTALIGDQLTQVAGVPVLAGVVPVVSCAGYFGQVGGDSTTEYTLLGMLAKGPGNIRIRKPADETITNVGANDDDHLRFYGQAGRTYLFEALLVAQQNTITDMDIKVGWTLPAGAAWTGGGPGPTSGIAAGSADGSTGAGANWRARFNSTGGALPFGIEVSGGAGVDGFLDVIPLHGSIKMGSTSGVCAIMWGQNVPATATTRVKEGSYLKVDMTSEYTL